MTAPVLSSLFKIIIKIYGEDYKDLCRAQMVTRDMLVELLTFFGLSLTYSLSSQP